MRTEETDVLIVGAGPTGMVAAALLARSGVSAITLSKHSGPANQPRASYTNQRTIEVFRDLGIEDEVHAVGTPAQDIGHNVMATSFAGREILRYRCYGAGERLGDYRQASPCINYNIPQHVLEPVLLKSARTEGGDVRFRHELVDIRQTDDRVIGRIRHRDSGEEYEVHAKYALAADGGRSLVAEQIGFAFEGEAGIIQMANAWIEVDLTEHTAYRPAGQYIILQPGGNSWVGSGTFVTVKPWTEWLLTREISSAQGEADLLDDAIISTVRSLIGDSEIDVKVKGTGTWQVNSLVATDFRIGRVFVAGDAAHRHSPSGGLGTNTSVQDAFNLAWKLALVLKGKAGPKLLDSYHAERQPVGRQIVERSTTNLGYKKQISEALGLRRGQTPEEGWKELSATFSDVPEASERRDQLARALKLQDYRSNAHGVEMGQRYVSAAVVDDGTPFPEPDRDPAIYYQPTTHPGARLPHAWLENDRKPVSTMDLVGHDRFSLITGIGGEPWMAAAKEAGDRLGLEIRAYQIGFNCEYADVVAEWYRLREISDNGALLVRPDGHVAWRSFELTESPKEDLLAALKSALAL